MYENLKRCVSSRNCDADVSICVPIQRVNENLHDGCHHLCSVRAETTRDGEVRPMKMLFSPQAEPQKTGLMNLMSGDGNDFNITHDASKHSKQRDHEPHFRNFDAISSNVLR